MCALLSIRCWFVRHYIYTFKKGSRKFHFVLEANGYTPPQSFLPLQGFGLHLNALLQNNGANMPSIVVWLRHTAQTRFFNWNGHSCKKCPGKGTTAKNRQLFQLWTCTRRDLQSTTRSKIYWPVVQLRECLCRSLWTSAGVDSQRLR